MATKNDRVVLELKKKVDEKKKLIGAALKPIYHTNLSLTLRGQNYNLNVQNKEQLQFLIADIGALTAGYSVQGPEGTSLIISGFSALNWLDDLKTKYSILTVKEEQTRLKAMEDKLHNLLSADTKVSLELEDIAKMI